MVFSALASRPNQVIEKQKLAQASHQPIYRRLPRSNLYLNFYFTAFAAGTVGTIYGIANLVRGKD